MPSLFSSGGTTPILPPTQEAEVGQSKVQGLPRKHTETLSQDKNLAWEAGVDSSL